MTDIPGQNPGEWGKRQYEVQVLTPNLHRPGERWRALGEPYDELAKAEYAITDLAGSLRAVTDAETVAVWRKHRVRVMEKVITCQYGKQMSLPDGS